MRSSAKIEDFLKRLPSNRIDLVCLGLRIAIRFGNLSLDSGPIEQETLRSLHA